MPDINMQVFEEVQRNQLVTEVDIQTQVALDDYQVQLSDIANPTQSQDNVVIDRFGEFLSHWNESLDFDTWIKMSMEVAGKRILMLRGNSNVSSISSISDTFIDGSEFNNLIGWTQQAGTWTVSGGLLHSPASGAAYLRRDVPISESSYVVTTRARTTNNIRFITVVEANNPMVVTASLAGQIAPNTNVFDLRVNWSWSQVPETFNNDAFYISEIDVVSGSNIMRVYDGNHNYLDETPTRSDGSGTGNYWGFMVSSDDNEYDWIHVRKHTTTEPTWIIDGIPQNIVVALKLLGRAG